MLPMTLEFCASLSLLNAHCFTAVGSHETLYQPHHSHIVLSIPGRGACTGMESPEILTCQLIVAIKMRNMEY